MNEKKRARLLYLKGMIQEYKTAISEKEEEAATYQSQADDLMIDASVLQRTVDDWEDEIADLEDIL